MKLREVVGDTLVKLVEEGNDIVIVDPEMISSTGMNNFENAYPERTFTVGIAEQNAVGIAVGLASYGKIPFVSSLSCFLSTRSLDQIRVGCAYGEQNVKLIGGHGGIATGPDGATHQAIEDIAIIRSIPNIKLFVPADGRETELIVRSSIKIKGPVYIRLTRPDINNIYKSDYVFKPGKASILREGIDVAIISCGIMVTETLKAAEQLAVEGIDTCVINMSSIKPLDTDMILKVASTTGAIVTAEDHNIYGGLGSAVSETLIDNYMIVPLEKVAIHDKFGKSGDTEVLFDLYGISTSHIIEAVKKVVSKKQKLSKDT